MELMELKEETVSQETVYEGIIVNIRQDKARLADGRVTGREVIEHPGGVAVFAVGEVVLELPAGKLEKGEDPRDSGLRELEEETGLRPGTFLPMGCSFSSPGILEERIHLFFAKDLVQGPSHPDDGEFLEIVRVPYTELMDMVRRGEIHDSKTLAGILKASLLMEKPL